METNKFTHVKQHTLNVHMASCPHQNKHKKDTSVQLCRVQANARRTQHGQTPICKAALSINQINTYYSSAPGHLLCCGSTTSNQKLTAPAAPCIHVVVSEMAAAAAEADAEAGAAAAATCRTPAEPKLNESPTAQHQHCPIFTSPPRHHRHVAQSTAPRSSATTTSPDVTQPPFSKPQEKKPYFQLRTSNKLAGRSGTSYSSRQCSAAYSAKPRAARR